MKAAGSWLAALVMAAALSCWTTHAAATTTVTLLLSDTTAIYREVAQALDAELAQDASRWRVRIQSLAERDTYGDEDLIVPIGLRALQQVLAEPVGTPVWSLLVPRQTFQGLTATHRRPLSALYLDHPLSRHLHMIRTALPTAARVGVLFGPHSASSSTDLAQAAAATGIRIVDERVTATEDLIPALERLRGKVDILLLLPDPVVVSRATLPMLLMHSYRARLPVAAYSTQLIEAGAMLGLYSTPGQIGTEAGARLRIAHDGKRVRLPAPDHPYSYDVMVNRSVASSLDIRLPVSERIRLRMLQDEEP